MINPEKHINRREFLKYLIEIAKVATVAAPIIDTIAAHNGPALTRSFWELLETGTPFKNTQELEKQIQDKFGVLILPAQNPKEIAETISPRKDWDQPRLWAVHSTLEMLPEDFYSPLILYTEQKPLKFSLYENTLPNLPKYVAKSYYDKSNHEVQLVKEYLGQTLLEQFPSKRIIVHELTHAKTGRVSDTGSTFKESAQRLADLIEIRNIEQLRHVFASVFNVANGLSSWSRHVGYGALNFDEFWSVAAEYYIGGRDAFIKEYIPYLGLEKTEKFYSGLKEELFKGRVYKAGKLIPI